MSRRIFTRTCCAIAAFIATLALSGCATTPRGNSDASTHTTASDARSPQYLRGVNGPSAVRIDQVRGSEVLGQDSAMREGLIAGDAGMHLAAAMFRVGDTYTLDLIVLNHGDQPLLLHRQDLSVVDRNGHWLGDVTDWKGATEVGLRARAKGEREPGFPVASRLSGWDASAPSSSLDLSSVATGTKSPAAGDMHAGSTVRSYGPAADPMNNMNNLSARPTPPPNAPETLHVDPQSGRSYWGYWKAGSVAYPLTAFVMLGNRHVVFEFTEPPPPATASAAQGSE